MIDSVSRDAVSLSWVRVDGATSHRVEWEPASPQGAGGEDLCGSLGDVGGVTETEVAGLVPGTRYRFRVFPSAGDGEVVAWLPWEVLGTPLENPPNLMTSRLLATSVRLSWDPVEGATVYLVEKQPNVEDGEEEEEGEEGGDDVADGNIVILTDTLSTTHFDVTGLAPGLGYGFRVAAGCDGVFETVGSDVVVTPLEPVKDLRVGCMGDSWVEVWWGNPLGATQFIVEKRDHEIGATDGSFEVVEVDVGDTRCRAIGLVPGKPIDLCVVAGSVDGVFEARGNMVVACLVWDASAGATAHMVESRPFGDASAEWSLIADSVTAASIDCNVSIASGIREFRVRSGAFGAFGGSGSCVVGGALALASGVRVVESSPSSVVVSWDDPTDPSVVYRLEKQSAGERASTVCGDAIRGTRGVVSGLESGVPCAIAVFAGRSHDSNGHLL